MSEDSDAADQDGRTEAVRGRRAPYARIGDWVLLSDVSRAAKAAYAVLAMHVSSSRDDRMVWPSREAMAEILGYSRVASVDPLIAELVKLGAVEVERRRVGKMRVRNRYIVHETPPPGYSGHETLKDFYLQREQERQERQRKQPGKRRPAGHETAGGDVVRSTAPRSPVERTTQDETAGGDVVRSSGPRSPVDRTSVVRSTGLEPDEVNPNEKPPPPGVADTTADAGAQQEGVGGNRHTNPDGAPAGAGLDRLVAELVAAQPGWSPEVVASTLTEAVRQQRRDPQAVAAAARALAAGNYGPTGSPRRLLSDGPWWAVGVPQQRRQQRRDPHRFAPGQVPGTCYAPDCGRHAHTTVAGVRLHPDQWPAGTTGAAAQRCKHGRRVCQTCAPATVTG